MTTNGGRIRLVGRQLALVGAAPVGLALSFAQLLTAAPAWLGVGARPATATLRRARRFVNWHRRWAARYLGVAISAPYLAEPSGTPRERFAALARDPATWRDQTWLVANGTLGGALLTGSLVLLIDGVYELVYPAVYAVTPPDGAWAVFGLVPIPNQALAFLPPLLGVALLLLWWRSLHPLTARYARLAQSLSTPIAKNHAVELRRLERDLHDGAQARLVAMGMTLNAAERLLEKNPDATRALLAEAREASAKALAELRDLVRGIHPPMLADRGLADAIRALALDCPLRVEVTADLPGRLEPAVESAAYFAVSELLTNAVKHAVARHASVDIRHEAGVLRISVGDDGRGGADPSRGTGLAGIVQRLAAFDGVLAVHSPPGGPTTMMMELPCELSSPKTSSC